MKTLIYYNQNIMVPFENDYQTSDYFRVQPIEDSLSSLSPAESEISTSSAEYDSVRVNRLENKLYSVVELLEEAIRGHQKLRTEILPRQRSEFDQLCDKLHSHLSRMKAAVQLNTNDVRKEQPKKNTTNSFDSMEDSDGSENRFSCTKKFVAMYEDSIEWQISEFVNWHELWQADLIDSMLSHSRETSKKLKTLAEEIVRIDSKMAAFRWDNCQQNHNPFASVPDLDELDASYKHQHRMKEQTAGHRTDERVEFTDRSHSNTLASDRVPRTSTPTNPANSEIAEPEVLCVSIASISPVSSELPSPNLGNPFTPNKLQQIFSTLQLKRQEQSLRTVSKPQEVHHQRAAANEEIEELWKSIETHRVEALPVKSLGVFMRTFVLLSLMFEDKELFYEHALFCALQLRNPANVDELAVVTNSSTDANCAASSVDWSAYKSSRSQYLLLLPPQEKKFFGKVTRLRPKVLVIWCSAYACLLLRLSDRGVGYVRRQLRQLNRQLADAYHLDEHKLPKVPIDSPWFVGQLRQYSKYAVNPVRRNTLFKGLIERYENKVLPLRTMKLLNFLLLTSLRYRGMSLITLVDECRKLYEISLAELVRNTFADETRTSWQTYERFTSTFEGSLRKEYKYCEVFRPQMYADLHFNANFNLCFLLCALIDIRKLKNGGGLSTTLYHKVLKKVRENDDSRPPVNPMWRQKCVQIAKKFAQH